MFPKSVRNMLQPLLIKEMNMNAVRSHYPSDKHFLEICDSLGLFYLDEFAGWQNSYDTETGMKLLPEMINRDVNILASLCGAMVMKVAGMRTLTNTLLITTRKNVMSFIPGLTSISLTPIIILPAKQVLIVWPVDITYSCLPNFCMYWATLESDRVPFTVYSESDGLFFRVFTPEEPALRRNSENTMWEFPTGDISFLYDIPAMRSGKTIPGPGSQPSTIRIKKGDDGFSMKFWFDFRAK